MPVRKCRPISLCPVLIGGFAARIAAEAKTLLQLFQLTPIACTFLLFSWLIVITRFVVLRFN